ncbi:MAG: ribulose-phosphate 3-epimerase, partial [Actinomycetota bacterium]
FLELLDLVIVMTVEPGFGGQAFLETMLPKIETAAGAVMKRGLDADIEVDGGIDPNSAARARAAGANVFVAGTSIFDTPDPAEAARGIAETIGAEVD